MMAKALGPIAAVCVGLAMLASSAHAQTSGAALAHQGEAVISTALPYARVARLQNDIVRTALGNHTPSLSAGTPVFQMTYHYVLRSGGVTLLEYHRPMWCGAAAAGEGGACVVMFEDGPRVARISEGSPYYPRELFRLLPCNAPDLADDSSAERELPLRRASYVIDRIRPNQLRLSLMVSIDGRASRIATVNAPRAHGGGFTLTQGAFTLTMEAADGNAVAVADIDSGSRAAFVAELNVLTKEGWVGLGPGSYN